MYIVHVRLILKYIHDPTIIELNLMCSMGVNKFMKLRARLNKLIFIYYHIPSLDSFNDILSFLHAYNFEHANH